jgi:hypothetical protein
MNADEIMQVLRLAAMGRVNHPDQIVFCEKLAALFGPPAPEPAEAPPAVVKIEQPKPIKSSKKAK